MGRLTFKHTAHVKRVSSPLVMGGWIANILILDSPQQLHATEWILGRYL